MFPLTEAVARRFRVDKRGAARITVGVSGTRGGFRKFCQGETDLQDASRPILRAEMAECRAAGVRYFEIPVAFDALTVAVSPRNTWVDSVTVDELRRMCAASVRCLSYNPRKKSAGPTGVNAFARSFAGPSMRLVRHRTWRPWMSAQNSLKTLVMSLSAMAALSACGGADEVASPGEGAFAPPPPAQTPPPAPPPSNEPPPISGPPGDCPEGFDNLGVLEVPATGEVLRNCQLPQRIIGNLVVPAREATVYAINGRVDVGEDQGGDVNAPIPGRQRGVLTIEAGVRLYGSAGLGYIVVNRGSQIFVQGTATEPVIMTSRQSILRTTNVDSIGQWGGLVILGRAPINTCPGEVAYGDPACETQVEGANAFYGGNNAADNSGTIRYLRLMHSGFQILADNELNGITLAGVGSGTTIEYVQVHNSSDDGIEWFGGTVNARYLVFTGIDDDSVDTDSGYKGALQFVLVVQRENGGDRMNEMSNVGNRQPPSNPKIANFTYVGRAGGGVGILMNQGANVQYYNGIVTRPVGGSGSGASCLDVDDAATTGTFHSVFFSCPQSYDDDANGQAATLFGAGSNNVAQGVSTLTNTFINGDNENAVTAFDLTMVDPFFVPVDYIGAVRDENDTWWQGWTCGLTESSPC